MSAERPALIVSALAAAALGAVGVVAAVVSDRTNSMLSLALLGISWPIYRLIRQRRSAIP